MELILDSVSKGEWLRLLEDTDMWDCSPLYWACRASYTECVSFMQHRSQHMNSSHLGGIPLHWGVYRGNIEALQTIHQFVTHSHWIHLLQMTTTDGSTVVHRAAWNQSVMEAIRDTVSDEVWSLYSQHLSHSLFLISVSDMRAVWQA